MQTHSYVAPCWSGGRSAPQFSPPEMQYYVLSVRGVWGGRSRQHCVHINFCLKKYIIPLFWTSYQTLREYLHP